LLAAHERNVVEGEIALAGKMRQALSPPCRLAAGVREELRQTLLLPGSHATGRLRIEKGNPPAVDEQRSKASIDVLGPRGPIIGLRCLDAQGGGRERRAAWRQGERTVFARPQIVQLVQANLLNARCTGAATLVRIT
jgi:hypothetical protein